MSNVMCLCGVGVREVFGVRVYRARRDPRASATAPFVLRSEALPTPRAFRPPCADTTRCVARRGACAARAAHERKRGAVVATCTSRKPD